jgi:hypothetical protein
LFSFVLRLFNVDDDENYDDNKIDIFVGLGKLTIVI